MKLNITNKTIPNLDKHSKQKKREKFFVEEEEGGGSLLIIIRELH